MLIRSFLITCLTAVTCFAQSKDISASSIQAADIRAKVADEPLTGKTARKLRLRVRLTNLSFDTPTLPTPFIVPSIADKVFELPEKPVTSDLLFEGKSSIQIPLFDIIIKWGFHGGVGQLQHKLIDDLELDTAGQWLFIDTSSGQISAFKAFVDGKEIVMQGRVGIIVERY